MIGLDVGTRAAQNSLLMTWTGAAEEGSLGLAREDSIGRDRMFFCTALSDWLWS